MLKLRIDPEADALHLRLSDAEIIDSEEVKPDIILDFDRDDHVIGFEILNLSQHLKPENVLTTCLDDY